MPQETPAATELFDSKSNSVQLGRLAANSVEESLRNPCLRSPDVRHVLCQLFGGTNKLPFKGTDLYALGRPSYLY